MPSRPLASLSVLFPVCPRRTVSVGIEPGHQLTVRTAMRRSSANGSTKAVFESLGAPAGPGTSICRLSRSRPLQPEDPGNHMVPRVFGASAERRPFAPLTGSDTHDGHRRKGASRPGEQQALLPAEAVRVSPPLREGTDDHSGHGRYLIPGHESVLPREGRDARVGAAHSQKQSKAAGDNGCRHVCKLERPGTGVLGSPGRPLRFYGAPHGS